MQHELVSIRVLLAAAITIIALSAISDIAAKQAIPPASDCTFGPRTIEEIEGLLATPETSPPADGVPRPESLPTGAPADAATQDAMWSTMWEAMACVNKGAPLQLYALSTDHFLQTFDLGGDRAALESELESTTTPTADDLAVLAAIWDVRLLADGRAGAFVAYGSSGEFPQAIQTRYVFFVPVGDRWLIDEIWSEPQLRAMGVDVTIPESAATPVGT